MNQVLRAPARAIVQMKSPMTKTCAANLVRRKSARIQATKTSPLARVARRISASTQVRTRVAKTRLYASRVRRNSDQRHSLRPEQVQSQTQNRR